MPKLGDRKFVFKTKDLQRLYEREKQTIAAIACLYECSTIPVTAALRAAGISVRHGGNSKGCALPLRHDIDADELRSLYIDKLWSSNHIGEHFGCSNATILVRLRSNGINVRHHNDTKRGRSPKNRVPTDDAAIIAAYAQPTMAITEVARALGYTEVAVTRVLREHCVSIKPQREVVKGKRTGRHNANWRPYLTDEERSERRDTAKHGKWRLQIYQRDFYRCQCCGDARGGNLNAHHIEAYKSNKARRWDVENGITLCEPCHHAFHSRFGYGRNDARQLTEFIAMRQTIAA
jgi:5-methylcytosine-specific restriction endonuclease McrA